MRPFDKTSTGGCGDVVFGGGITPEPDLTLSSYTYHTLSIIISLQPQVNSFPSQVKCTNRWGGKEFTRGGKKVNIPPQKIWNLVDIQRVTFVSHLVID